MYKAMLIGHLGSDPGVKMFDNGGQVSNFSLATSRTYKDKDGNKVQQTEWHRINAFGKLSEIVQNHFHKGMQAYVEGEIKTRSWENEEGEKRYSTEITMLNFEFLSSKGESKTPEPKSEMTREQINKKTEEILMYKKSGDKDKLPF